MLFNTFATAFFRNGEGMGKSFLGYVRISTGLFGFGPGMISLFANNE